MTERELLDFVWSLLHTGGPLTVGELVYELATLSRTGAVSCSPLNRAYVAKLLDQLYAAGRVDEAPADVWHACYVSSETDTARQGVLFA